MLTGVSKRNGGSGVFNAGTIAIAFNALHEATLAQNVAHSQIGTQLAVVSAC
jgi:hypothetical protein